MAAGGWRSATDRIEKRYHKPRHQIMADGGPGKEFLVRCSKGRVSPSRFRAPALTRA
jgi:hypothetical protein